MTSNIARSVYSNRPRGFSTPAQLTFRLSTNPTIAPVSAENGVILGHPFSPRGQVHGTVPPSVQQKVASVATGLLDTAPSEEPRRPLIEVLSEASDSEDD